jgi:hypothetical protein
VLICNGSALRWVATSSAMRLLIRCCFRFDTV